MIADAEPADILVQLCVEYRVRDQPGSSFWYLVKLYARSGTGNALRQLKCKLCAGTELAVYLDRTHH